MAPSSKTIRDAYEVFEDIGHGGMAIVYKAMQTSLNRVVAIKEIKPEYAKSSELSERFKREARTGASLVHENIVSIYNFGEEKKGSLFIVMEFVDGQDVRTILKKAGTMPPRIAAIIMREVAKALAYAHAKGLIHRDVKPGNIMVSRSGEVKLMDFGIVRELDSDLTRTGAFLGTPNYMAPEQFLGEQITSATDIFSAGVVLYELLAGQKPFIGDSEGSLAKKVRTEKEIKLRTINPKAPRRLQKITRRCLMKNPARRFRDAEDLAHALDHYLGKANFQDQRKELAKWVEQVTGLKPAIQPAGSASKIHEGKMGVAKTKISQPEPQKSIDLSSLRKQIKDKKSEEKPSKTRAEKSKTRAEKKSQAKKDREPDKSGPSWETESGEMGEKLVKWTWRMVLLAIAVMAAVIGFLVFDFKDSKFSVDRETVQKIIDWIKPGPE